MITFFGDKKMMTATKTESIEKTVSRVLSSKAREKEMDLEAEKEGNALRGLYIMRPKNRRTKEQQR